MTTRSSNIVTIKHPAQSVHAALTTEEYWAHVAATLSPEPGEVHEFVPTDGGAEITLYEVLPLEILPEAVRSMISQALKVKRVVTVGPLTGETAALSYTADVKGTPVDFKGTINLSVVTKRLSNMRMRSRSIFLSWGRLSSRRWLRR